MKVEDLILQLQDVISAAKSMPFSGGKVMVREQRKFQNKKITEQMNA